MVVVSWLVLSEQIRFERQEAAAAAIQQNENRAAAFRQYTLRTLEVADLAINHAIQRYRSSPRREGAAAPVSLHDLVLTRPAFAAVYLTGADGRLLATTRDAGSSVVGATCPAPSDRSDRLSVSPPVHLRGLKRAAVVCLTRSFGAEGGVPGGRASVLVSPTVFTEMALGEAFSPTDLISLIGLDGVTRARRTGNTISWGENLAGALVLRRQNKYPNGRYVGPSALDGIPRFFSHRRLPGYPLFVTSGVTVDTVFAKVSARERTYLLVAALFTVATLCATWMLIRGISRRERVVEELAVINRRLSEAQRVGLMGDWEFDVAADRLHWSAHLYEMYERSRSDEVLRLSDLRDYFSAEDAEAIRSGIGRVLTTGARQEHFVNVTLPSGAQSTRHIVAVPTRNADGVIVGIHGTDRDVTTERKLRQIEAKLAHGGQVDAMNAMASTLAHELNHPLAIATNYLAACRKRLARATAPPEASVMEALEMVATQVRNAGEIIHSVRAVASGSGEYVSLSAICRETSQLVHLAAPRTAFDLSCAIDPAADTILAVSVQVHQILMNLILNSIDAASSERDLAVVVSAERVSPELVAIRVTDNGRGLPADTSALFSAFFTTKETGLGLGLSICRTLVEAHGGEIAVEQTGPTGTTIRFTLASPPHPNEPCGDNRSGDLATLP